MKARQAHKIMRRYYATGKQPRMSTFCEAFRLDLPRGSRYLRPFNIARSITKLEVFSDEKKTADLYYAISEALATLADNFNREQTCPQFREEATNNHVRLP